MANLTGFQHIGEKIFELVAFQDLLTCRSVCQSWKLILDNPMHWLLKLNKFGQTKKAFKEFLALIRNASKAGIPPTKIGYCLFTKYTKLTGSQI